MISILNRVPENVSRAFVNLQESNNQSFKIIIEWMKDCQKAEETCYDRIDDDKQLRWSQGRHRAVSAFIEANDSARDTLKQTKK